MEVEDAITTTIFDVGVAAIAQRSSEVRVREMGFKQQRMEEETTTKVITSTTILPSRNEEKEKENKKIFVRTGGESCIRKPRDRLRGIRTSTLGLLASTRVDIFINPQTTLEKE